MLKRVAKVTSLLVTATSIVSMVPAIAAEYEKVEAQEGTIYSASSKGNGKFIIDRELDNEDEAIYLLQDGKYTKLADAEAGDTIGDIYEDKYLVMTGDDGNYAIDLTTGKETEEFDFDAYKDQIVRTIKKKIKNDYDGRFNKDFVEGDSIEADDTVQDSSGDPNKIFMYGMSGKWSKYKYQLKTAKLNGETTSSIYSDDQGNYIDSDYNLGKVNVYTTTGSSVSIKNTEDTYEVEENSIIYEYKAQISNDIPYDEGFDTITRSAQLTIWRKKKDEDDNQYGNVTDEVEFGTSDNHHTVPVNGSGPNAYITVLQRISKAQASDTIDGIKYAKDAKTYFITDEDGNEQPLLGLGTSDKSSLVNIVTGNIKGIDSISYDPVNKEMYAEGINFKSKGSYNYIETSDQGKVDDVTAFNLGGGLLTCIGDGFIQQWNHTDAFEKWYQVDSSMSNISGGDKDNLIVWDEDHEIYSIVSNKASSEEQTNTTATTNATATTTGAAVTTTGWVKNTDGTWYYLKDDGIMATGWQNVGDTWYYLNVSGVMQTGWINDDGTWYYCNESGEMLANTTIDGYVLGANGAWIK